MLNKKPPGVPDPCPDLDSDSGPDPDPDPDADSDPDLNIFVCYSNVGTSGLGTSLFGPENTIAYEIM